MTGTAVSSPPPAGGRPQAAARAAAIAAVLLVAAVLPVRQDLTREPDWGSMSAGSRMQLGWEAHTRRGIDAGELPLWNPYHLGGRPHLADPQTLAVYPPHVLLRPLPISQFFAASFVVHAWMFGIGAFLVARRLGAGQVAAVLAAVGAMLPTVLLPRPDLAFSPVVYPVAWLPLIVAFAFRSLERPGLLPHPGLAAVLVMALTGVPRGQVYALATVAACYLFAAWWPSAGRRQPRRALAQLSATMLVAAGLSSFALLPHARLWTAAAWTGGLVHDDRRERDVPGTPFDRDGRRAAAFAALDDGRTISTCDEALDASEFLWFGVPGIGGYGGAYTRDYVRFASIATGERSLPSVVRIIGTESQEWVRGDLLRLLNVRYTAGCASGAPEAGWTAVGRVGSATIAEAAGSLPRAFWTCMPQRVPRAELEYRLRTYRYDEALTLRDAEPLVNIRWVAGLDDAGRRRAEAELHVAPLEFLEDRTWRYALLDASRANLGAMVAHPRVEDTAGFDRGALVLPPPPEPPSFGGTRSEWLLGGEPCEDVRPAAVTRMDRADGHLVATVEAPRDGIVFLSETFHPDRAAWVDGERAEAIRVNLAFTGIPVPAGSHRIELRAGSGTFWVGTGISALTLLAWSVAGWRTHRR